MIDRDGALFAVRELRNIAPSGVSLVVAGTLADFSGTPQVAIRYQAPEVGVTVNGCVVWSREAEGDSRAAGPACVLGVKLLSPNLLLSFIDQ